ncbi:hypothetical protein [Arthrobacter sp. AZCC_0090]|uniref:hypothetical protein n=1 Tax=Arthrobacter sp. AZCC_0090 TaxID=2735881 RepID=UPI00161F6206|nr:hypothetical protein [Arthrobacter sp. AZCC_0090]MBB6406930.1 hypothetical protein [Arthrobacter sp. AZCC_0090]
MVSYSALEEASSKNPHDWGRAMATAMTKLLDAARIDGRHFEHEFLYGEELRMRIDENNDGATVKLTWTPTDEVPQREEPPS